jgi:chromate transporter
MVAGVAFIVPGLIVILGLAAVFLGGSPPRWVLAAGAGAGAAVPAVALQAASGLLAPSWRRASDHSRPRAARWVVYLAGGVIASALTGAWVVLVLLGCGVLEVMLRRLPAPEGGSAGNSRGIAPLALLGHATVGVGVGGLAAVSWVALKVGALSYGGGFVIIPLMQADAVHNYRWMTNTQFLNAVALGQITPGPVTQTVAVVGYSAAGLLGGVLASAVAFCPSFLFILLGADHFDRLRANSSVRAFLDGAGPAAIGAIAGAAIPLTRALSETWQYPILAGAAVLLLAVKRGPVLTLLAAAAIAVTVTALGAPLSR